MKILMFHGRAGGHNIMPFLEYFTDHPEHELVFMYSNDRTYHPPESPVRFIRFSLSPFRLFKTLFTINKKYDLIWYHGGHSALIFFIFSLFRSRQTMFIFNVWNEWLIQQAIKSGIKSTMFRYGIRNADVIHCNWHGTANLISSTGWNNNIEVFYWGLQREHFEPAKKTATEEAKKFIESIPSKKVKFFFPKSISRNSRHDLIVEACSQLIEKGQSEFIVYLWLGNTNDDVIIKELNKNINRYGLTNHVILQSHGFLPFSDMQLIWKKMDVGLQIAENEQLSTTFLEPQFYRKEIIVSDILPYRIYNQLFSTRIELIPLNAEGIELAMSKYINGYRTDHTMLDKRRNIIIEHFDMDQNLERIINHYKLQLQ